MRRLPQLGEQRHRPQHTPFHIDGVGRSPQPRTCLSTPSETAPPAPRCTTDAGRGNVTGLWNDLGRFKTPTLPALAARAPYFHNGIAKTLDDVVRHYGRSWASTSPTRNASDLVAFLKAL